MLKSKTTTKNKNMLQRICDGLKTEPEQLKSTWYSYITDAITLPLRIITYPLRAGAMWAIAPATRWNIEDTVKDYKNEDTKSTLRKIASTTKQAIFLNDKFAIQKIKYTIPRNKNCEMIMAMNHKNPEQDISKRKLVITVSGNGILPEECILSLKDIDNINNDVLAIGFPKNATSSAELVDATVSAMLRAKQAGYEIENIKVTGHSLGGAITALALQKVQEYLEPNKKFAEYVNHKSFTNLGNVVTGLMSSGKTLESQTDQSIEDQNKADIELYKQSNSSFLSKFMNGLAWLLGVQLNAVDAFKSTLPVEKIKIITAEADKVIHESAAIKNAIQQNQYNITFETVNTEHNDIDDKLFLGHNEYTKNKFFLALGDEYFQQILSNEQKKLKIALTNQTIEAQLPIETGDRRKRMSIDI